jgi:hypothetical protein
MGGGKSMASEMQADWGVLLNEATPNLYSLNPFRVLGLPVEATPRAINNRERELMILESMGFPPEEMARLFTGFLPCNPPPDEEAVREALYKLSEPDLRMVEEFFWFWPQQADREDQDAAFSAMKNGDYQQAINIWNRQAGNGDVIAVHNLAVLYHALALDIEKMEQIQTLNEQQARQKFYYWKEAFSRWRACIGEDSLWKRMRDRIIELDDPRATEHELEKLKSLLPAAILKINATLLIQAAERESRQDIQMHNSLIGESGFAGAAIEEVFRPVLAPLREKIKLLCSAADKEINEKPENGNQVAARLMEQGSRILQLIDLLLERGNSAREEAHEQIVQQLISAIVVFANQTEDWETGLRLMEQTLTIAESDSIRERIQSNIEIARKNMAEKLCWFCEKRPRDDKSAISIEMYGNVQKTREWNGVRTQWNNLTVTVPRCKKCKAVHNQAKLLMVMLLLTWTALGGLIYKLSASKMIALLILVVLGLVLAFSVNRKFHGSKSVKLYAAYKDYTVIKQLQEEGWCIGSKPEGVS